MEDTRRSAFTAMALGSFIVAGACRERDPISDHGAAGLRKMLAEAVPVRSLEPRLTGGFVHGVCRPSDEPDDLVPEPECEKMTRLDVRSIEALSAVAGRLQAASRDGSAAETARVEALWHLVWSYEDRSADQAVSKLREAIERVGEDPEVLSDLSAAYYVRAQTADRPPDLMRALATADAAMEKHPTLPEAHFNRALALESLFLKSDAVDGWKAYQDLDQKTPWSAEASRRLASLKRPTRAQEWDAVRGRLERLREIEEDELWRVAHDFPQEARQFIESEVLGSWADTHSEMTESSKRRWIRSFERWGRALEAATGDSMILDAAEVMARASPEDAAILASAHRKFTDARRLFEERMFATTVDLFREASVSFYEARSPLYMWADQYLAVCTIREPDIASRFGSAESQLRRLRRVVDAARHPILAGYVEWRSCLDQLIRTELSSSNDSCLAALDLLERSRQVQDVAAVHFLMAEISEFLGDRDRQWRHLYSALSLRDWISDPSWLIFISMKAADGARQEGLPEIALYFLDQALRDAEGSMDEAILVSEVEISRAWVFQELGKTETALHHLERAVERSKEISDTVHKNLIEAQIHHARGVLLRDAQPENAVKSLDQALSYYRESGSHVLISELLAARGRAYLALDRPDAAEDDFLASVEFFERHRRDVFQESNRISFFDRSRRILDELIALHSREKPDESFVSAERGRARELLQTVVNGRGSRSPPRLETIRKDMPEKAVMVHYTLLRDRLLAWVIARGQSRLVVTPVGEAELTRSIERYLADVTGNRATALGETAERLYRVLMTPLRDFIPPGSELIVVPDKVLNALPFAGLRDPSSGRFLVQDHTLLVSPSAEICLHSAPPARPAGSGAPSDWKAAIVGEPAIWSRHPELPRLPGAGRSARRIAEIYGAGRLLVGVEATATAFLAAASESAIVHFGGHAMAHEDPLLASLLLAPESLSDGVLTAREIYSWELPKTRLVVLAACNTGRARISEGEGVLSLARPFLKAGVPAVVATLWEVEDQASSELFVRFHSAVRQGTTPAEALRAAQLAQSRLAPPSDWAAYVLIGRLDNFQLEEKP